MFSFTLVIIAAFIMIFFLDPTSAKDLTFGRDTLAVIFANFRKFILPSFFLVMRPAVIIHLWLPLFALSSLFVKLIYLIFRAVEWAQWFLKQGDAHPLKAIGIVGTIIVFGSAMVVKEAWMVL